MKLKPFDLFDENYKEHSYTRDGRRVVCIHVVTGCITTPSDLMGIIIDEEGDPWMGHWNIYGEYYFSKDMMPNPDDPYDDIRIPSIYDLMIEDED